MLRHETKIVLLFVAYGKAIISYYIFLENVSKKDTKNNQLILQGIYVMGFCKLWINMFVKL